MQRDWMAERGQRSRLRLIIMVTVGVVVAVIVGVFGSWTYAPVCGWASSCIVYICWVWFVIGSMDARQTGTHATREDPSRGAADALITIASIGSLAAVVVVLVSASAAHGAARAEIAILAVSSVALSWTLIHTLYTLRYARLYYSDTPGGIDFNQKERPSYGDFAYIAFTLGMTYQVSDTDLQTSAIRMAVLKHTLLSYLFGSVILATTVNLVAGLTS